jgi:hypothetical protein
MNSNAFSGAIKVVIETKVESTLMSSAELLKLPPPKGPMVRQVACGPYEPQKKEEKNQ